MSENCDIFVHDLSFLCWVWVRMGISIPQLAVLTALYRLGEAEAYEIAATTGLSKSNLYRQLDYLESKDAVELAGRRKDWHRQEVKVWRLTLCGKRTVRAYERLYRKHCADELHRLRVSNGKEKI